LTLREIICGADKRFLDDLASIDYNSWKSTEKTRTVQPVDTFKGVEENLVVNVYLLMWFAELGKHSGASANLMGKLFHSESPVFACQECVNHLRLANNWRTNFLWWMLLGIFRFVQSKSIITL